MRQDLYLKKRDQPERLSAEAVQARSVRSAKASATRFLRRFRNLGTAQSAMLSQLTDTYFAKFCGLEQLASSSRQP